MRIIIGAPGNGADLKNAIHERLRKDDRVTELVDASSEASTYPALSRLVAASVAAGEFDRAILTCGTGIGTAIAASKVQGVRAATAHDLITARGAIENYDAQVLCMGQNVIAPDAACALIDVWLDARHDPEGPYGVLLRELIADD